MILDAAFLGFVSAALAIVAVIFCRKPPPAGAYILVIATGLLAWGLGKLSAFPFLIDVGHHNFIYSALGYAAGRGMPPENPFAAGMPVNFPWVAFAIYAEGAKLFGLTPGEVAKIGGIVCSAVAVTCICVLVRAWKPSGYSPRGLCVAAVTLALLAGTIFWGSFPKLGINLPGHPLAGGWWESRGIPVLSLFNNYTTPMGLVSALSAYTAFVVSLVRGSVPWRAGVICVGAAISSIYPFALLALGLACAGAASVALLLGASKRSISASAIVLGLGGFLGYLHVRTLRPSGAHDSMALDFSLGEVLFEWRLLLLYQGLLLLLCAMNWRFFRDQWMQRQTMPFLLTGSVLALNLATLAVRFLDHTDYKLWVFSMICLGILAGPTLYSFARRTPLVTAMVLAVLMFPLSRSLWQDSLALRNLSPPLTVETHDGFLRIADPALQEPYDWLAANTPKDAVIIERGTTWTPVFANRSLFIGKHDLGNETQLFGFLNPIHIWLADYCGFGEEVVAGRLELIDKVYSGQGGLGALKEAAKQVPGRSIYVLGKSEQEMEALDLLASQGALTEAANGDGWGIWEVTLEATP